MDKIIIKSVSVYGFRNYDKHTTKTFTTKKGIILEGKNGLGKTNLLNAIYWCLTTNDIEGNALLDNFISKSLLAKADKGDTLLSVKVEMNVGTVEREVRIVKGKRSQILFINGIATSTLKDGEIQIDKMLGLLELTTSMYQPSSLSIRKILLNPDELKRTGEKDLRELVVKQLDSIAQLDIVKSFRELPEAVQGQLKDLFDPTLSINYNTVLEINDTLSGMVKKAKAQEKLFQDFIKVANDSGVAEKSFVEFLTTQHKMAQTAYSDLKDKQLMYQTFLDKVNREYENYASNIYKDLSIKLLETNGDEVKPVCKIYLKNKPTIELKNASTSERIVNSIRFINQYIKHCGYTVRTPLFIDELESIDTDNQMKLLSKELKNHYLVGSQVSDSEIIVERNL